MKENSQGFICPDCKNVFSSGELLATHFEKYHLRDEVPPRSQKVLHKHNHSSTFEPEKCSTCGMLTEASERLRLTIKDLEEKLIERDNQVLLLSTQIQSLQEGEGLKNVNGASLECAASSNCFQFEKLDQLHVFETLSNHSPTCEAGSGDGDGSPVMEHDTLGSCLRPLPRENCIHQGLVRLDKWEEHCSRLREINHGIAALKENLALVLVQVRCSKEESMSMIKDLCSAIHLNTVTDISSKKSTHANAKLTVLRSEIASLSAKLAAVENEKATLTRKLQETEDGMGELKELKAKNSSLKLSLKETELNFITLTDTLSSFENAMEELREKHKSEITELMKRISTLDGVVSKLREELKFKSDENESLTRENAASQQSLRSTVSQLEGRILTLSSDASAKLHEHRELCEKLQTLKIAHQHLENLYNDSLANNNELSSQTTDLKKMLEQAQLQLEVAAKKLEVNEARSRDSLLALCELGNENQKLKTVLSLIMGKSWRDETEVHKCERCLCAFTLVNRKHHCRVCGGVFCDPCSSFETFVASHKNKVRACKECSDMMQKLETNNP